VLLPPLFKIRLELLYLLVILLLRQLLHQWLHRLLELLLRQLKLLVIPFLMRELERLSLLHLMLL